MVFSFAQELNGTTISGNVTITTTPATEISVEGRHCTTLTTGAILLADIIPTLVVKLVCPFLPFYVQ